jgi:hypothetical protein
LTIVGVVALTAAISFAPESLPAALPPVRLEGPVVGGNPTQTELVVVPSPSVDLGERTVTTVAVPQDDSLIDNESLDSLASADVDSPIPVPPGPVFPDPPADIGDSADSADSSVDSPDDD